MSKSSTFQLNDDLNERVERFAKATDSSVLDVVTEAVEHHIRRSEFRQKMLKEADASWQHYKETGLHVTAEEVDAWLARLEAGEDVDPPECHV